MHNNLKPYFEKLTREGLGYKRRLKNYKASQFYNPEQLAKLQNEKLRGLIHHCYKNVPYYTDLFKSLKLTPDDINSKDDLVKLPFLDKMILKNNTDKLIAKNKLKLFCRTIRTSGSTGTPTELMRDISNINHENAMLWRVYDNAGATGLKRVLINARILVPFEQKTPPFWVYDPAFNELKMSLYHLLEGNVEAYANEILKFSPEVFCVYPSVGCIFADYFKKTNQQLKLKAIIPMAETLLPNQRALMEEVFGCAVHDWYGQAERVAAIEQCEKGTYHIVEDYSIVETIDTDTGVEIVGTGLYNYAMPLIRFRTWDIIEMGNQECTCGRHFRVVSRIHGRTSSFILSPEGSKISLTLLGLYIKPINNIAEAQFVQEKKGELIVNIVQYGTFTQDDRQKIINVLKNQISPNLKVTVNVVDNIPRGPSGKFVGLINKVPMEG